MAKNKDDSTIENFDLEKLSPNSKELNRDSLLMAIEVSIMSAMGNNVANKVLSILSSVHELFDPEIFGSYTINCPSRKKKASDFYSAAESSGRVLCSNAAICANSALSPAKPSNVLSNRTPSPAAITAKTHSPMQYSFPNSFTSRNLITQNPKLPPGPPPDVQNRKRDRMSMPEFDDRNLPSNLEAGDKVDVTSLELDMSDSEEEPGEDDLESFFVQESSSKKVKKKKNNKAYSSVIPPAPTESTYVSWDMC